MFSEYENIEPIIYKQMKKCSENLSHAYLFNLNGNVYAESMIIAFVKSIICCDHNSISEYEKCELCKRISDGNYLELKKIYPDGLWIKKEQLDDLQKSFSTKAIESNKRIYIIYEAEKLNKASANSLLKFLEEPAEGIVAILLTNNMNQMLSTIVSRCQIFTFGKNKVEDYIKYKEIKENVTLNKLLFSIWKISDSNCPLDEYKVFIDNVIRFIRKYEVEGLKTILYSKSYFHDFFKEKEEILKFYECMILFYTDVLNYKLNEHIMYYDDYLDDIKKISSKNKLSQIINKLNVITNSEKTVKNNVNTNMLVDCMIIDMEETVR